MRVLRIVIGVDGYGAAITGSRVARRGECVARSGTKHRRQGSTGTESVLRARFMGKRFALEESLATRVGHMDRLLVHQIIIWTRA